MMKNFSREIAFFAVLAVFAVGVGCAGKPENLPYPCELAGSVWRPADFRPGAYLEFTMDFRVIGSSGKNRFFAPVKCAPGKRIRVSPVAFSMIDGKLDDWETTFFKALDNTRGYVFDDDRLALYDEERRKLLEFRMMRPPREVEKP